MRLRLSITLVSIAAFAGLAACSENKADAPDFDTKYKSEGNLPGEGNSEVETQTDGTANPEAKMSKAESLPYSQSAPKFDLKDAISILSKNISCQNTGLEIVGGAKASDEDLVAASTFRIVMNKSHYCSATLIGKNQLLTAAHCFDGVSRADQIEIGFGADGLPVDNLKARAYKIHPQYKGMASIASAIPETQLYDLAVIVFEGELSERMAPVRLAEPGFVFTSMPLVIAGYGVTSTNDQTRRPLAWIITNLATLSNKFNELQIEQKTGRGACYGDSGGPAYIAGNEGRCLQLIGSVSGPNRGSLNCDAGGGLLMDVTRQRVWISCAYKSLRYPLNYINTSGFNCD